MKYKQHTKKTLNLEILSLLFKRLTFSLLVVFFLNIYPIIVFAEEMPEIISDNQEQVSNIGTANPEDNLVLDNNEPSIENPLKIDSVTEESPINDEIPLDEPLEVLAPTSQQENPEQSDGKNQTVSKNSNNSQIPKIQNSTGSLSYSYNIEIPKGRKNIEPNISLSYNSQQLSDLTNITGYGWEFDIPYIERINKNGTDSLYSNNYFTSSESGELQEIYTGLYGPKVENGDFNKYEFDGYYWTVKKKNGLVYKYGETSNGRVDDNSGQKIYRWMLTEIRDQYDNFVRYEYYKDQGQIYPHKIFYTGNGTTDGIFQIEFLRESRNDTLSFYNYTFLTKNNYRIHSIKIKKENILLKEYNLNYITGDNTKRSLLSSVSEVGYKNNQSTSKPPTEFSYQTSNTGWTLDTTNWTAPFIFGGGHEQMLDINGDGLQDITKSVKLNFYPPHPDFADKKEVWLRNSNSKTWSLSSIYELPIYFFEHEIRGGAYQNTWEQGVRFVDINGDLLPDIIKSEENTLTSYNSSTPPFSRGGFDSYLNTGSGWVQDLSKISTVAIQSDNNIDNFGGVVVDLDNDGLSEVLRKNNGSIPYDGYQKNNGQGFNSVTPSLLPVDNTTFPRVRFVDLNGDNLQDIIFSHHDNVWQSHYYNSYINKGDSTWILDNNFKPPFDVLDNYGRDEGVFFVDINSDGLVDVLPKFSLQYRNSSIYKTYLNTGSGWVQAQYWNLPEVVGELGVNLHITDIDNNGSSDIFGSNNINTYAYINNNTKRVDLLKKITLPTKGFSEIEYKKSSDYLDFSGNLLNPNLPLVVDVVSKITSNDNNGVISQYTYKYEGGYYYFNNRIDRKFAGFHIITEIDDDNNLIKSYYHQGNSTNTSLGEYNDTYSKIGRMYRQEKYNNSGILLEKIINNWDEYNVAFGINFVKLNNTVSYIHHSNQIDKKSSVVSYLYNNTDGNLIEKQVLGEVDAQNDGTFIDTGNDKIIYIYEYSTNISPSTRLDSYIKSIIKKDYQNTKFSETKYYYDNQSFGDVSLGNITKESEWISGGQYKNTEKTYNSYGLVFEIFDSLSNKTSYIYDSYYLYPVTITNPLLQTENHEYNYLIGKPSKITDVNNQDIYYDFDGLGRIISERSGDNSIINNLVVKKYYLYNDISIPNSVTVVSNINNKLNNNSVSFFDGFGRNIQTKTQSENFYNTKDVIYNKKGLIYKESLPYQTNSNNFTPIIANGSLIKTYSYDSLGRIISELDINGSTLISYNLLEKQIIDQKGNKKKYNYDITDNLISIKEYNGLNVYTTNYFWDINNNLSKIIDSQGNVRNFTYNALGLRLIAEDLHDLLDKSYGTYFYSYDTNGNLISVTNSKSQVIQYSYDSLNRLLEEDYTSTPFIEASYSYDTCLFGVGKLCTISESLGLQDDYTYLPTGLIQRQERTLNSISYVTEYEYDYQNNKTKIIYPDISEAVYTYNNANNIEKVDYKDISNPLGINLISDINYGPHNNIVERINSNGTKTVFDYDQNNLYRLNKITTTDNLLKRIQDISYSYDIVGNILSVIDTSQTKGQKTSTYTYDDLYRLTSATTASPYGNYSHSYSYDSLGNIITKSDNPGTYSYQGNIFVNNYANPHAITSVGTAGSAGFISYNYDANGNLISDSLGTSNTYDYKNRLTRTTTPSSVVVDYKYDSNGARILYKVGSDETYYINDLYNIKNNANITKHINIANNSAVTIEDISGISLIYYNHTDNLSGSNVITNSSGIIEQVLDYYPFGTIRINDKTSSFDEQKKYTGHEIDSDTGYTYMKARYQDSLLGRFISQDPVFWEMSQEWLLDPQNQNSYSYARNNPIVYVDKDGRDAVLFFDNKNNNITLKSNIYIYGRGATTENAKRIENNIQNSWNKGWSYYDKNTNSNYSVNFDVNVKVVKHPSLHTLRKDSNVIKIEGDERSHVSSISAYKGHWRETEPDPAPHEFGHLIGLDDRYSDEFGSNDGWKGNIMAEPAMKGVVQQKNIDTIINSFVSDNNSRIFPKFNTQTKFHIAPRNNNFK